MKMKKLKILKKTLINGVLSVDGMSYNILIFSVVCLLSLFVVFCGKLSFGQDQADLTSSSSMPKTAAKETDFLDKGPFNRIIDMNGVVGIDGSLRVLESNYTKVFDLVETSTPVIAGSNHARLFLRADGSKQSLIVSWDDGTYTRITGN